MGQEEESISAVGGTDVGRSKIEPLRIEPQGGQVSENGVDASNKERADVFHEDEARPNLANDPSVLSPEARPFAALPCFAREARALPRVADVLTRETARDEIHHAAPWAAVKGGNVVPDRRRIQPALRHARDQDRHRIGFPLDETDGSGGTPEAGEEAGDAELEPGAAGEESEAVEGGAGSGITSGR